MPEWRSEIRRRLESLALPPAREMEIVEEISQHLELDVAARMRRGLSEAEARREAERGILRRQELGYATS